MTVTEVVAREAALFRAEDQRNAAAAVELAADPAAEFGQRDYRLLSFSVGKRAGTDYQRAVGDSFFQGLRRSRVLE